jgi:hypothetical protein
MFMYQFPQFRFGDTTIDDRFVFEGSIDWRKELGGGVAGMNDEILHAG